MNNIHHQEWRVEVDREDFRKRIKPEFSEWIQGRGTGYREIKVYFWDGVATTHEKQAEELRLATDAFNQSVHDERQALLKEMTESLSSYSEDLNKRSDAFIATLNAAYDALSARAKDKFYVGFYNRDDALFFKLTWGGKL